MPSSNKASLSFKIHSNNSNQKVVLVALSIASASSVELGTWIPNLCVRFAYLVVTEAISHLLCLKVCLAHHLNTGNSCN